MNVCTLVGRLCKEPELSYTPNGKAVCKFSLAVDNPFRKDSDGKRTADFFNVVIWGDRAENASKWLLKGKRAAVSGRIEVRQYQDKDGNKRTAVDLVANDWEPLNDKQDSSGEPRQESRPAARQEVRRESPPVRDRQPEVEDDLPF